MPCRNSRGRRRRRRRATPAKRPPLCLRSTSERKGGGQRSPPLRSALAAGTRVFAGAAFGGNRLECLWLGRQSLCLPGPSQELAWSSGGRWHLSPNARSIPAPSPGRLRELVLGETGGEWGCLAVPLHLHPARREPAKLSRRESLFRILTFSRMARPLEAQFYGEAAALGEGNLGLITLAANVLGERKRIRKHQNRPIRTRPRFSCPKLGVCFQTLS